MHPVLLRIGWFPVNAYGFFIVLGLVAAATLASLRARSRGLPPEWIWDLSLIGLVTGVVGGRLGYLLFERPDLLSNPREAIAVWHGGMVFYVGLLIGTVCVIRYIRWRGMSIGVVLDLFAASLPLGHALARFGCFLAGCCYGAPASWGVTFPVLRDGTPRQPTQLYEAAACLALFGLFWALRNRPRRYDGRHFVGYLASYAVVRFLLEFLRADDRGGSPFLGLSPSQGVALLGLALLGVADLATRSRSSVAPVVAIR